MSSGTTIKRNQHEVFLTKMEQVANSNGKANHSGDMVMKRSPECSPSAAPQKSV